MQTPTTAQLRIAIEALTKLGQRLHDEAAHSVVQLPETPLGAHYARNIDLRANEQISRIQTVVTQLKNWRQELLEQADNQQKSFHGAPENSIGNSDSCCSEEMTKLEFAML
jgi:hypothetical protein